MHVARFAFAPRRSQTPGEIHHRLGVISDAVSMKGRRGQPSLALPFFTFARQQAVADQALKEVRAQRHCFDEVLRIRRQDIFDFVRVIEKQRRHVEKPRPDDVTVITLQKLKKTKEIKIELYDNGEIDGVTGAALDSNVTEPGPVLLQGDHGKVSFRNIKIKPLSGW